MKNTEGKEVNDLKGIQEVLAEFYSELYRPTEISKEEIHNYLKLRSQEKISTEHEWLEAPFMDIEISEAIRHQKQKQKKTNPGLDGISAEFYGKVEETIRPLFKDLLDKIRIKNIIPKTWKEAIISGIPKQGLDLKNIKNYRPISLINSDYKIFTNILANRL